MADLKVQIQPLTDWPDRAVVSLRVGSEGAVSLAASTPSGGTVVSTAMVWPNGGRPVLGSGILGSGILGFGPGNYALGQSIFGYGLLGVNNAPPLVLHHRYSPADVDATLPVGVDVTDSAGNTSTVIEDVVQLADAPDGVTDLVVDATANSNEAALSWTASRHIS